MEFDSHFEVPASAEQVWAHLLDVEAVVPCMPGAELTETVDDTTWKGKVTVKLGAASLSFRGTVTMTERDADAKRVVLDAKGMEARGKGQATAKVTSTMAPAADGGTRVDIHTDLTLSGQAAQMGRGMIVDVSRRLTGEFADCVAGQLTAQPATDHAAESTAAPPGSPASDQSGSEATATQSPGGSRAAGTRPAAAAKPVSGLRLGAWALWRALGRVVRRVLGRGGS